MTSHFLLSISYFPVLKALLAAKQITKACSECAIVWTQLPIVCHVRYVGYIWQKQWPDMSVRHFCPSPAGKFRAQYETLVQLSRVYFQIFVQNRQREFISGEVILLTRPDLPCQSHWVNKVRMSCLDFFFFFTACPCDTKQTHTVTTVILANK